MIFLFKVRPIFVCTKNKCVLFRTYAILLKAIFLVFLCFHASVKWWRKNFAYIKVAHKIIGYIVVVVGHLYYLFMVWSHAGCNTTQALFSDGYQWGAAGFTSVTLYKSYSINKLFVRYSPKIVEKRLQCSHNLHKLVRIRVNIIYATWSGLVLTQFTQTGQDYSVPKIYTTGSG